MRLARLAAVLVAACALAPLAAAQSEPSGILVAPPPRALAYDAGLGPRPADAPFSAEAAGPRERSAWRGAKRGFLVGVGIGVVATVATFAVVDKGHVACEWFCAWNLAAAAAVPLTVITTVTGAIIGSTKAGGPVPIRGQ